MHDGYARVTVIIPALNEEASLGRVLEDLPPVGKVIVADNGSTDRTAAVARAYGALVVAEPRAGYGAACLRGMRAIREDPSLARQTEVVVFIDGDYSDHPDQLPRLLEPLRNGELDFVIGSRALGDRERGAMPPQSVYGNKLACLLMRVLLGAHYTDLGPFRAIRYQRLLELNMRDKNYGWTIEMQIKAARLQLPTGEVPVSYRCRIGQSKISGTIRGTIKAGTKILLTIARYTVWPGSSQPRQAAGAAGGCDGVPDLPRPSKQAPV